MKARTKILRFKFTNTTHINNECRGKFSFPSFYYVLQLDNRPRTLTAKWLPTKPKLPKPPRKVRRFKRKWKSR